MALSTVAVALARRLLPAGLILAGSAGCCSSPSEGKTSRDMNRQMDRMERMGDDLSRKEPAGVIRSQSPGESRVNLTPDGEGFSRVNLSADAPSAPAPAGVALAAAPPGGNGTGDANPAAAPGANPPNEPQTLQPVGLKAPPEPAPATGVVAPISGEAQVRVVANVANSPVYLSEVREAVNHRLSEILGLPDAERKAKERKVYTEELRRILERELILDELFAKLRTKGKPANIINELQEAAAKETERRMREFKKRAHLQTDEEFNTALQSQGLSLPGLRRKIEREFMVQTYLRELLKHKIDSISLGDIRDYYDEHPNDFRVDDSVKWQDLFINASRYGSRDEARAAAEGVAERARKGEDFAQLVKQFDQGLGKGAGEGEKRGEIRPLEAEPVIFGMRAGDVAVIEMETGFHVARLTERTYAGRRPFDEPTQSDIRLKLQAAISEREYRRIVQTLWRRNPPQILVPEPD